MPRYLNQIDLVYMWTLYPACLLTSAERVLDCGMAVPSSGKRWDSLDPPLSKYSLEGVRKLGFQFMTPVQSATIPYFMQNKDVAVEAITGSGKTLAFVIPILEILTRRPEPWTDRETGALILTPTRELATQIAGVLEPFLLQVAIKLSLVIGGCDLQGNITAINDGAHVIVATPGRLVDMLSRQDCNLASSVRSLEVLVLDEADRLLELGFEQSINTILSYLPKQRRTGLFSATLNQDVKALIRAGLRNPVTVTVRDRQAERGTDPTPKSLSNFYLVVEAEKKVRALLTVLNNFCKDKVIVFFSTCASVCYFGTLTKRLLPTANVLVLHGKMHSKRQRLFEEFSSCSCGVLMCTDVMARGVDFPSVDWVVQFDPPSSTKSFVHRCGRTARMGQQGQALVMLLPSESSYVEFLSLNQHISLEPYVLQECVGEEVLSEARELGTREREIYEQGKRAFVSFVHFYYKHECKLIFQAKALDLVGLAKGYGLPHLPRMPELRGQDTSAFTPHPCAARDIRYRDKGREKQRQQKLQQLDLGVVSKKKQLKNAILIEKAKQRKGNKMLHHKTKRKQRMQMTDTDLEELAKEARLLKKFKAGKITKEELEAQLGED